MKRFLLFSLVLALLFSTGCTPNGGFSGNFRSIEQLQLVHTLGIDTHRDGVEVAVSCGEAAGGEENKGPGILRLSGTGMDISDGIIGLQRFAGKEELYFAHTRYVLIGEAYARMGLEDLISYLEHSPQLRSDLPLFLVKNGSAKELITKAGGEDASIFDLMESVVRSCLEEGTGYPFTCGDIAIFNAERGCALACVLEIVSTKEADDSAEEEELTPIPAGYGIIRQGSLVGYLSREAARGVNLLMGQWGTEEVTLELGRKPTTLQFQQVKVDLQPEFGKAGTLTGLTVALEVEAEGDFSPGKDKQQMQQDLEEAIKQWLDELFRAMRATGTDFLGFGPEIAVKHPQWQGDLTENIGTLPLKADVRCEIVSGDV